MPKRKLNQRGLSMLDYRMAFVGWEVTQGWLAGAFAANLSLEEAKNLLATQRGTRLIHARRQRRLGVETVKRMLQVQIERYAHKFANKGLMPEARSWLEKTFPTVRELSRHRLRSELAGSTDITGGQAPGP